MLPRARVLIPVLPNRSFGMETLGPPRFLDEPPSKRALLSDPGGTPCAWPLRHWNAAATCCDGVGSHEVALSGLNHTARSVAVYASQQGLPLYHARLAPGCWPNSTGRDWLPVRVQSERFPCYPSITSSFPRLRLAHRNRALGCDGASLSAQYLFESGRGIIDTSFFAIFATWRLCEKDV